MPPHDWSRVPAGRFQDFRHGWVGAFSHLLSGGLLSSDYCALIERISDGVGLTFPTQPNSAGEWDQATGCSGLEIDRRDQSSIVVRRACGDRASALVAARSPGHPRCDLGRGVRSGLCSSPGETSHPGRLGIRLRAHGPYRAGRRGRYTPGGAAVAGTGPLRRDTPRGPVPVGPACLPSALERCPRSAAWRLHLGG